MEALTYTQPQWDLVLGGFVLAFLALAAAAVYLLASRGELSTRYRPSSDVGAVICLVAALSYVLLVVAWITGFTFDPATSTYAPSSASLQFRNTYRYVDWTVSVPLLTAELLVVTTLVGRRASRTRALWMVLAVVMIVTGYVGEAFFGASTTGLVVWGLVSTAAFVPLYVSLLRTGLRSARELGGSAGANLRRATLMLSWTWGVYPLAYCVPLLTGAAGWAVGRQLAFDVADVCAKVAFGVLVHACAKERTAEDLRAGLTTHPEPVHADGELLADARPAHP